MNSRGVGKQRGECKHSCGYGRERHGGVLEKVWSGAVCVLGGIPHRSFECLDKECRFLLIKEMWKSSSYIEGIVGRSGQEFLESS